MSARIARRLAHLATGPALAAALSCAPAQPGAMRVAVTNRTGVAVDAIHLSPHDAPTWEEDVLASTVLADGATVVVRFDGRALPASWDLRVVGGDGRYRAEWKGLDLRRIASITLRDAPQGVVAELEPAEPRVARGEAP